MRRSHGCEWPRLAGAGAGSLRREAATGEDDGRGRCLRGLWLRAAQMTGERPAGRTARPRPERMGAGGERAGPMPRTLKV
jgi:hypothetical protein